MDTIRIHDVPPLAEELWHLMTSEEGRVQFFTGVAPCRLHMLLRIGIYLCVSRQHLFDSIGYKKNEENLKLGGRWRKSQVWSE